MAITFLNMQTRVAENINQALTDDTLTVTLTEVKANLNRGYKLVRNAVVKTNQNFYVRLTKADLVATQSTYSIPTDARKLTRLEIGYSVSTSREKAIRVDRNAFQDPSAGFSEAVPFYSVIGNQIELFPTPTLSVDDGLWLWILEEQADLSSNGDTPVLPLGYDDLPISYATWKALRKLGVMEEASDYKNEFYNEIGNMESELVMRSQDNNDFVIATDV